AGSSPPYRYGTPRYASAVCSTSERVTGVVVTTAGAGRSDAGDGAIGKGCGLGVAGVACAAQAAVAVAITTAATRRTQSRITPATTSCIGRTPGARHPFGLNPCVHGRYR